MLQERSGGRADVGSQNTSSTRQLEQHVSGAKETRKEAEDKEGEVEAGFSLVAVSQGMKDFLNAMSSHEGAELPWWDRLNTWFIITIFNQDLWVFVFLLS